ncbi:hypothetical protein RB195_026059 [Necator americanus]|uniref:glucuronosyltransferase n=1 Tax=Necator americanus TaxID=51031 RepID=A0ABR1EV83_NECAM
MKKVVEILHGAGHYVTLLSSVNNKVQTVPDGVTLKEFDYGVKSEALENVWTEVRVIDRLRAVSKLSQDMLLFCEKVFDRIDVIDWMRVEKFEIAITSGVTCFQPLLRLAGIQRSVVVTSAEPAPWITRTMGMPSSGNPLKEEMSYFQRAKTVISGHIEESLLQNKLIKPLDEMGRRIVGDRYTSMKHAVGRSSFIFVNSDELLDFPRPLTSQWFYIGGIDAKKRSSLCPHWNTILSMRSRSVLVSYDDSSTCGHLKETLLRAFSEIPDTTFIWHLQEHSPLNQSNVVLVPKLPERDLLADPRVIAIINDARTNSLHDVAFGGKPVVCIPSDQAQLRNCHQLKKRGLALVRNCRDITPDDVKKMIEEAATNEVRNSAKMFSKEVTSRTTSPEERLTRAVEFAAKYGGSVDLNSNDDSVGVMQRYNLDVFLPIAVLLAVIGLLIAWIARTLWIKCKKSTMVESNGTSDITDLPRDGAESKKPSTAELEREEPASSIDSEVTE